MRDDRIREKFCVIIPSYDEAKHIGGVVRQVLKHVPTVVVIDDGSSDATSSEAEKAGAIVLKHEANRGKAAALKTGFDYALKNGFDALIAMDGDGQHDPADIPRFIETYLSTGLPVLLGSRMADRGNMPRIRRWTNMFTSWLLSREMKQLVPDTQCGYRLYRCNIIPQVSYESERFAAESEILLRIAERGLRIGAVPVKAVYRDEKSKINPVRDTVRFFSMLIRYRRDRRRR